MQFSFGLFFCLFLSLILLTKKSGEFSEHLLALWFLIIGVHLSLFNLFYEGSYQRFPHLLGLEKLFPFFHGPFLWTYARRVLGKPLSKLEMLLHLLPALLAFLSILEFFGLSGPEKIWVYQQEGAGFEGRVLLIYYGVLISGFFYAGLSGKYLYTHWKSISKEAASREILKLKWLCSLTLGICGIWVFTFFGNDYLIFSSAVSFVLWVGYFGIKRLGIFTKWELDPSYALEYSTGDSIPQSMDTCEEKYQFSALSEGQLISIHTELMGLMKGRKEYLTPEITIAQVAGQLGIHPNILSEVINRVEGKSFVDLINTFRVEEFIVRAREPENQKFTLLALAFDCGFNSKTSFNRNFKNIAGKTPTQFLSEVRSSFSE